MSPASACTSEKSSARNATSALSRAAAAEVLRPGILIPKAQTKTMMTSRAIAIRQTLPITRLEIDHAIIFNGFACARSIRLSFRQEICDVG
jgi:hypothetical protein